MKKLIYKIKFDNVSMTEAVQEVDYLIESKKFHMVVTPNLDFFYLVKKNSCFKEAIAVSSLCLADGKPIIWFSRLYNAKIREKVSGSDLAPKLLELAQLNGYKILLLGGKQNVSDLARNKIKEKYPNSKIFNYSPSFGFEHKDNEIEEIINLINEVEPHMVFCCFGAPKQELFLFNNKEKLPNSVYLCLGATIDFLAGTTKRAPKWMSRIGLEWVYRLSKEPRRLFKRYLRDILMIPIVFFYRFSKEYRKNKENFE